MPRGDATGPMGMGPMTGGGAGYCAGFGVPGYMNNVGGRGGGFGYRKRFFATGAPGRCWFDGMAAPSPNPDPETEKQALNNQAKILQTDLEAIKKLLEELSPKVQKK